MRVLIVSLSTYSSPFNDGKLAELARRLDGVTAVASNRSTLWGSSGGDRIFDSYQVFLLRTMMGKSKATTLLMGLKRVARHAMPTVVHVECEPWQGVAVQSILLARKLGIPVGVQFAENGPMLRGSGGSARVRVSRWAFERCQYAIGWSTESTSVARTLAPRLPVATFPGTGVDIPDAENDRAARSDRWFGRGSEDSARIAFVGRFSPEKGLVDFLETVDHLASRIPIRVAIAGGNPSDDPLLCEWLRSRPWALAHGVVTRPQVAELLTASDVLVSPSRTTCHVKEQFGLSPLEAMSRGTPVFAFDCGALKEVVGAGGVVVPEGRVDYLVDELERYFRSPPSCRERVSGLATAQAARFTNAALAEALVRIWSDLPDVRSKRST